MFNLQLLNSQQHLFYLIRFGFTLMILYVDPRISFPGHLVNMVTSIPLSRLTKIMKADLGQIRKTNIVWTVSHLYKDVFDLGHDLYSINIDIYVMYSFVNLTELN